MSSGSEDDYDAVPDGAPRSSSISDELKRLYSNTKDIFAPYGNKDKSIKAPDTFQEAPHPGTEGVSFEEALKKCPHLAKQYGQQAHVESENGECSHAQNADRPSRCPYQNGESQEWPMRAVLMFIAYNVISLGVTIEFIRIGFVACAYHMGMLHISEFIVLYLVTARMSSYKLLGLLLMMTNKGGPVLSYSKQYTITWRNLLYGCILGLCTIVITGVSMRWAFYMEYFKTESQSDDILFSPLEHILIPIGSEFVYRGFMLKEMGRDLGAWFGITASSGWFCILQRGQASVKFAAFAQAVLWSLCTTALQGDLVPATMAHVFIASLRALSPSIYFSFFPAIP